MRDSTIYNLPLQNGELHWSLSFKLIHKIIECIKWISKRSTLGQAKDKNSYFPAINSKVLAGMKVIYYISILAWHLIRSNQQKRKQKHKKTISISSFLAATDYLGDHYILIFTIICNNQIVWEVLSSYSIFWMLISPNLKI